MPSPSAGLHSALFVKPEMTSIAGRRTPSESVTFSRSLLFISPKTGAGPTPTSTTCRLKNGRASSDSTENGSLFRPISAIPCAGVWMSGTGCRLRTAIVISSATSSGSSCRRKIVGAWKTIFGAGTTSLRRNATRSAGVSRIRPHGCGFVPPPHPSYSPKRSKGRSKIRDFLSHRVPPPNTPSHENYKLT